MPDSTYKIIELVGTSKTSWEDAAKNAVETAAKSLKDLRIAEVNMLDMKATLKNKGIAFDQEVRVYDICNPQAAAQALGENLATATLLPCRIAVYSSAEGSTIAMVNPTDLFASSGLEMASSLAADVERELMAIIDEAC